MPSRPGLPASAATRTNDAVLLQALEKLLDGSLGAAVCGGELAVADPGVGLVAAVGLEDQDHEPLPDREWPT